MGILYIIKILHRVAPVIAKGRNPSLPERRGAEGENTSVDTRVACAKPSEANTPSPSNHRKEGDRTA